MTKQHILNEIRRTAKENGGVSVGRLKFRSLTGIKDHDWCGKYWLKWSEAVKEAGLSPNSFDVGYEQGYLLEVFVALIKELGHFPIKAELRMKRIKDNTFPSKKVFRQFGDRPAFAAKIIEFCKSRGEDSNVVSVCQPLCDLNRAEDNNERDDYDIGFVYLLKSENTTKSAEVNRRGGAKANSKYNFRNPRGMFT